MVFIRKKKDGEYYICRRRKTRGRVKKKEKFYDWFMIKGKGNGYGISIRSISFPKQFAGKRVRLKVEVINDNLINRILRRV